MICRKVGQSYYVGKFRQLSKKAIRPAPVRYVYIVKWRDNRGVLDIGSIKFPPELVGQRIRIRIEKV